MFSIYFYINKYITASNPTIYTTISPTMKPTGMYSDNIWIN